MSRNGVHSLQRGQTVQPDHPVATTAPHSYGIGWSAVGALDSAVNCPHHIFADRVSHRHPGCSKQVSISYFRLLVAIPLYALGPPPDAVAGAMAGNRDDLGQGQVRGCAECARWAMSAVGMCCPRARGRQQRSPNDPAAPSRRPERVSTSGQDYSGACAATSPPSSS